MKRVFALLAAAVFWAAPAFAENVALLSGRGVATLEAGNVVAARKDALDQAMRHALEAAIPMAVLALEAEARKKAIASHVLRHPDRHFVSYETVKDAPQEDEYEIVIEAKIDLDRLARVIRALPVEKNAADGERDLLLVAIVFDKGDKRSRFKELETELIQRLDMMDYHPIDDAVAQSIVEDPAFDDAAKERLEKVATLGATFHCRYLLLGLGRLGHPSDDCPDLVRFIFADLRDKTVVAKFAQPISVSDRSCVAAAQESAGLVFARLASELKPRAADASAAAAEALVTFEGLREFSAEKSVRAAVAELPMVTKISLDAVGSGGRFQYRVAYEGDLRDLAEAVTRIAALPFKFQESAAPENRLTFHVTY